MKYSDPELHRAAVVVQFFSKVSLIITLILVALLLILLLLHITIVLVLLVLLPPPVMPLGGPLDCATGVESVVRSAVSLFYTITQCSA
jgi:hypothetical protein